MQTINRSEILTEFPDLLNHENGYDLVFDQNGNLVSALWRDPVYKEFDGRLEIKHFERVRLLITETGGQFSLSKYNDATQTMSSTETDKDDGSQREIVKKISKKDWIRGCLNSMIGIVGWELKKSTEERIQFYNIIADAKGQSKQITPWFVVKILLQLTVLSPFMIYAVLKDKYLNRKK